MTYDRGIISLIEVIAAHSATAIRSLEPFQPHSNERLLYEVLWLADGGLDFSELDSRSICKLTQGHLCFEDVVRYTYPYRDCDILFGSQEFLRWIDNHLSLTRLTLIEYGSGTSIELDAWLARKTNDTRSWHEVFTDLLN